MILTIVMLHNIIKHDVIPSLSPSLTFKLFFLQLFKRGIFRHRFKFYSKVDEVLLKILKLFNTGPIAIGNLKQVKEMEWLYYIFVNLCQAEFCISRRNDDTFGALFSSSYRTVIATLLAT